MTIRIFGSDSCEMCKNFIQALIQKDKKYIFIEAMDNKNDKLCDYNLVEDLPHIQIIKDGQIVYNNVRPDINDFFKELKKYES